VRGRPVIYLATSSEHKARELARLLGREVTPVPRYDPPPETGMTYAENARIKAWAGRATAPEGAWVIADDSGLEVAALDGAPGVLSARFGGGELGDSGRNQLLLAQLDGAADRRAAYVCVLCAIAPDGDLTEVEGRLEGRIADAPRGSGGFGYDPVFLPEADIRTVAELGPAEKDALSHRGRAARALRERLHW
jgi:XTP/dITP diphosphohydrolase